MMDNIELIARFNEQICQKEYPIRSYGWYLSQLPTDCVESAISNAIKDKGQDFLHIIPDSCSVKTAVWLLFDWDDTPEGYSYWKKVYTDPL